MGMYVVWLSPAGCGGFISIFWDAEMCSGIPPPQAALVTVASWKRGLWVVWCNSGDVKVKEQGREISIDRIQICVRITFKISMKSNLIEVFYLNICSLNVQALVKYEGDVNFQHYFKRYDIIGLCKTWGINNDSFANLLDGYVILNNI